MKNILKNICMCLMITLSYANVQASLGGDSATYAPVTFRPAQQFNKDGHMVGNYFVSSQTATIHNPDLKKDNGYTFTEVVPNGMSVPKEKVFIGSYIKSPKKARLGMPSSGAHALMNLYGVQQD